MNQLLALLATFCFLGGILHLTATQRLKDRFAFLWLMIAAAGVIAALSIPLLNRLAAIVGVAYMPTLAMLCAILFILVLLVRHTIGLSNQAEKIKTIAQEFAQLEFKVSRLEQEQPSPKEQR